ncbi:MAG: membrane protein insertion efficiency factor YidD [bacterium]
MKKIIWFLVKAYQRLISPFFAPRCRFYPSCSNYALEALNKYPIPKSTVKIIWRLLRCNPLFPGGFDPA